MNKKKGYGQTETVMESGVLLSTFLKIRPISDCVCNDANICKFDQVSQICLWSVSKSACSGGNLFVLISSRLWRACNI
jgi:hypothetical protein